MSYLGYDVLELNYNRAGAFEERLRRKFVLLSSKTGRRTADEQSPASAAARPFIWTAANATDPANYQTETLSLDPVAQRDYTRARTVLSFLKLSRLDEDRVEVSYPSPLVAEATIQVRELPLEAPL